MLEQTASPVDPAWGTNAMTQSEDDPLIVVGPEIADLVPPFLQNRRNDVMKLEEALAKGNWTIVRRIGHGMKGTGSAYGAPTISALGQTIEIAALQQERDSVEEALASLKRYLVNVRVRVADENES
jgi:HPt (histidine-containing phosphotransfer) domain-containing protein